MKEALQHIKISIILHLMFFITGSVVLILFSKYDVLLFVNRHHSPFLDVLMYHITRLPEISFIIFAFFLSFFLNKKSFVIALVSFAICGILIILFKNFVFPSYARPFSWVSENNIPFHKVENIRYHFQNGFPSGHTVSAFASLGLVGFFSKKAWVQILCFIVAVLSGYSRIYVGQHFYTDVYAGAFVGFTTILICYLIFYNKLKTDFWLKSNLK